MSEGKAGGEYLVNGVLVDAKGEPIDVKPSLSKLTKDELVAKAQEKGLETEGTKAELIARLEAAEQA